MDLELTNRVAIVTGGSQGIGKACAAKLAQEGATVVIAARGQELLDQVAGEIRAAGGKIIPTCARVLVGNLDHFDTSSDRAHNLAEVTADTFRLIHVRHAGFLLRMNALMCAVMARCHA